MGDERCAEYLVARSCSCLGVSLRHRAGAKFCQAFAEAEGRNPSPLAKILSSIPNRDSEVCGDDGARCAQAALIPWHETIAAAEKWNDTSGDCARTSYIAFEYSSPRLGSNLHRHVLFRNTVATSRPIGYIDAPRRWRLWQILAGECLDSDSGPDALAIPQAFL